MTAGGGGEAEGQGPRARGQHPLADGWRRRRGRGPRARGQGPGARDQGTGDLLRSAVTVRSSRMCVHACARTCIYAHTCARTCICVHACACMCTCPSAHVRTCFVGRQSIRACVSASGSCRRLVAAAIVARWDRECLSVSPRARRNGYKTGGLDTDADVVAGCCGSFGGHTARARLTQERSRKTRGCRK